MDSLSSISPSIVLPPSNPLRHRHHHHRRRRISVSAHPMHRHITSLSSFLGSPYASDPCGRKFVGISCKSTTRGAGGEEGDGGGVDNRGDDYEGDEVERALRLDGTIPGTSDEFVKRVSSRAYGMRRNLHQTFDTGSYDVLEANPWRETSKPVYVLTHRENQLCTMKTRRNRSEVERELGLLFSKEGRWGSETRNQAKQSSADTKFQMLVEDVREGVLVFEDENEAARYCDLLQGGGQGCEGVAELEASSVFDLCQKMRALAVLFRRGMTPPLPESLKLNLRARNRSLEDQEDLL
ncbi:hypothetical protein U1Q18_029468 [Sarracenia purpurea var. burkii]